MANRKLLRPVLLALAVVASCGPPGVPPNPVVGDPVSLGEYLAVGRVNLTPVCLATIEVGMLLNDGSRSALIVSTVKSVSPVAPGDECAFAMFLLNGRVDCVPAACGGVEIPLPLGIDAATPLRFTVWPNFRFLRLTLTATFGGASQTITDETGQIVCDPPTIRDRCVFAASSPN